MKVNKFVKWIESNSNTNIISEYNDSTNSMLFEIDNIRYKLSPIRSGNKVSYQTIDKIEIREDAPQNLKTTIVTACSKQQELIDEFKKYLENN